MSDGNGIDWGAMANAFATIMQLVCNFRQERGEHDRAKLADLMAYIEHHKFEEIKAAIQGSTSLQLEIQGLLNRDVSEVREQIGIINRSVAAIASRLNSFSGIAEAMGANVRMSDQAVRILKMFNESGATEMGVFLNHVPPACVLFERGPGCGIKIDDHRFLPDDIKTLELIGFIRHSHYNGAGDPLYSLTRSGAEFAKQSI